MQYNNSLNNTKISLEGRGYIILFWNHLRAYGKVYPYNEIVDKAKTFTRFIHGYEPLLRLFRFYSPINSLVKQHKMRSVTLYLTLGNISSQKQYLEELFLSAEWTSFM